MTSQDLMITILGLALTFGAVTVLRAFLKGRSEEKRDELREKGQERVMQTFETLAAHDTERLQMLADAIIRNSQLAPADNTAPKRLDAFAH